MSDKKDLRVFHGSIDISNVVNDYRSGAYTFPYSTGQYLYVASLFPFNNLWFEVGTPNAVSASVSVDIWWGNAWTSAVDISDNTSGLSATGRLSWNTDIYKGWDVELRSSDVTGAPANIYNMYWLRLSWNASLTASMTIKYIGQKFSNDDILTSFYPDLNLTSIKEAFEAGKTSWDEQHYMAAEHIIRDLKKRGIIKDKSQILDPGLFVDASCHKLAEIVYTAFGSPYKDQMTGARAAYNEALNVKFFNTDLSNDGRLDPEDRRISTDFMSR